MSVLGTYLMQKNINQNWSGARTVKIIPVFADEKLGTRKFVEALTRSDFENIPDYLENNAKRYGLNLSSSLLFDLEPPIDDIPPSLPKTSDGFLSQVAWSLKLRWWAWRNQTKDHSDDQIRLFVMYQSPDKGIVLPHSTGLRNGLIGLINVRATKKDKRLHNVILTHELMHIFGASDKYSLETGQPIFPQGYLDPQQNPLWPQSHAELMARSLPLSKTKFKVAERLRHTRIGDVTAREIGWLK